MFINFIGGTQLETEIILTAAHIGIGIVALCAERFQLLGNHTHGTLEGAQSVIEFADTAAAGDGEVELYAPVACVIGSLNGGDERCIGNTFENLGCLSIVLLSQCEKGIRGSDGARLMGILPVDGQMETLGHEHHAGRIGINTIQTDGCIAGRVFQKFYALIGVCKNTTGQSGGSGSEHHCYADNFNLIHLNYL